MAACSGSIGWLRSGGAQGREDASSIRRDARAPGVRAGGGCAEVLRAESGIPSLGHGEQSGDGALQLRNFVLSLTGEGAEIGHHLHGAVEIGVRALLVGADANEVLRAGVVGEHAAEALRLGQVLGEHTAGMRRLRLSSNWMGGK